MLNQTPYDFPRRFFVIKLYELLNAYIYLVIYLILLVFSWVVESLQTILLKEETKWTGVAWLNLLRSFCSNSVQHSACSYAGRDYPLLQGTKQQLLPIAFITSILPSTSLTTRSWSRFDLIRNCHQLFLIKRFLLSTSRTLTVTVSAFLSSGFVSVSCGHRLLHTC